MSYTVLARKWRPKKFSELVGQAHVMQALSNALDQQRLHHAYLFTGTRGVGKTTIARIFAKALNCQTGITSTPCGVCANCQSIDEGRFVDLIEVDAASKTKVDDTRELLDNVQYAAVQGRFKVYLIDEVHMLSKSSFNALLKTLEEPPEHVKFLLATTDPHKLPVTVLSRCLQFNLMRLTQVQIAKHLAFILQQEAIVFEEAALAMIAKSADGSARDSLSILDQAIAFGAGEVRFAPVQAMLGLVDQQFTEQLLQALMAQSAEQLKEVLQQLAAMGVDYSALLSQLIEALHQVALVQVLGSLGEVAVIDEAQLALLAEHLTPQQIQMFYQIALLSRQDMRLAPDERIGFEMAMLRMLAFSPTASSPTALSEQTGPANAQKQPGLVNFEPKSAISPVQTRPEPAVSQASQVLQNLKASSVAKPITPTAPETPVAPVRPAVAEPQTDPSKVSSTTQAPLINPEAVAMKKDEDHLASLHARLQQTLGKPNSSAQTPAQVTPAQTNPSPKPNDTNTMASGLSAKMSAMMAKQKGGDFSNSSAPSAPSTPFDIAPPLPPQDLEGLVDIEEPPAWFDETYADDAVAAPMVAQENLQTPSLAPQQAPSEQPLEPPFNPPFVGMPDTQTLGAGVPESPLIMDAPLAQAVVATENPKVDPSPRIAPPTLSAEGKHLIEEWLSLLAQIQPEGMAEALAHQSALVAASPESITLCVAPGQMLAKTELAVTRLTQALQRVFGDHFQLQFVEQVAAEAMMTPATYWQMQAQQKQQEALSSIYADERVAEFQKQFNMRLIESSIKPIEQI